jgi:hypothetical protein
MSDDIKKQLTEIEAMFVQVAREMTTEGDRVKFFGLAPATLFFADRPRHVVGHLSARQFVEEWDKGENSFAADPPNAVISFLESNGQRPEDAIVVLKQPHLEGNNISYSVDVLKGSLPAQADSVSIFIDPFGRPLSPVSVAGMHRRARRRRF